MKTNIIDKLVDSAGACRLDTRASERSSFTEFHITATLEGPAPTWASVPALFSRVYGILAERGIQPIQEKLYGRTSVRDEVLQCREASLREAGLDARMPFTWLEGAPLDGFAFVGLQIWGVAPTDGGTCVRTVENPATGLGRLWEGKGFKMLYLPSVKGTGSGGRLAIGHHAQAEQTFANIGAGLEAHGFSYREVVRTWIYVARLLEWYGALNEVRTAHYRRVGLGTEGGAPFPASTGIQCHSGEEECVIDVLALSRSDPAAAEARPIRNSPRQNQSFNYGSAFSRGMTLDIEGRRTVHISGTASINPAGASIHVGDAEFQSLETLLCIAALLEKQGGGLRDITAAVLYCKDRAAWEAWCRVTRLLGVPSFPKICVLADVCRDDLLVEMEAVAVI